MYTELEEYQFALVKPLIRGVSAYLSLSAIAEGKSRGRIWGNDISNLISACVWDLTNDFVFILAAPNSRLVPSEMNLFLRDKLGPIAKEAGYTKLHTILLVQTAQAEIDELFKDLSTSTQEMYHFYLQEKNQAKPQKIDLPKDYHLMRISREILDTGGLANIDEIRRCIMACWQSLDDYFSDGIGYVVIKKGDVASWCSTDYRVSGKCDLYVETFDGYQQKGIGTIVTLACVKECLNQKLEVNWHTWQGNLPSIKLAQRIGFRQRPSQHVRIIDV